MNTQTPGSRRRRQIKRFDAGVSKGFFCRNLTLNVIPACCNSILGGIEGQSDAINRGQKSRKPGARVPGFPGQMTKRFKKPKLQREGHSL